MDSAAFPVQRRVCVLRSSVPREAMRDSLPYCSNLANGQKRRRARKAPSAFLIYLGGNAACPPRRRGCIKPLYVTWLRQSVAKTQMSTANLLLVLRSNRPRTSEIQACPAQRLQTDFCISSAQESDTIARGAFNSYTFTEARFDHFDSLFSTTSSSTPGKPIDTYGPILGQTFSKSHKSRKVLITL